MAFQCAKSVQYAAFPPFLRRSGIGFAKSMLAFAVSCP
jgi:hypothetical protein